MRKFLATLGALLLAVVLLNLPVGTPATHAGSAYWWGSTSRPDADVMAAAGSMNPGGSLVTITMTFKNCDAIVSDDFYCPTMYMHIVDMEPGYFSNMSKHISPFYKYYPAKHAKDAGFTKSWQCLVGHHLIADFEWVRYQDRRPLLKHEIKFICGGGGW